jgi:hypothetical protein
MNQNDAELRESEHEMKCNLAAQVLRSFGTLRLEVTGLSMLPTIWPGDILFIERRDMTEIAAGDIVLFAREGKLIAHRVLYMTAAGELPCAITQGDALLSHDDAISSTELLGSVRRILRAGAHVKPRADLGVWTRATSLFVQHFTWVAHLLVFMHRLRGATYRREALCKN